MQQPGDLLEGDHHGAVTGFPAGVPTNRPLGGAAVELYRVSPETGERLGAPVHRRVTEPDGVWGPATVEPNVSFASSR